MVKVKDEFLLFSIEVRIVVNEVDWSLNVIGDDPYVLMRLKWFVLSFPGVVVMMVNLLIRVENNEARRRK